MLLSFGKVHLRFDVSTFTCESFQKNLYYYRFQRIESNLPKIGVGVMLPDLPGLKHDIQRALDRYLSTQVNKRLGFFNEVPKHPVHEGNRLRVVRADGSIDESELEKASAEMSIKLEDIPGLTLEKRLAMLNDQADQIASQISKGLFEGLKRELDKAGQAVDQRGRTLDAEAVFSVLEKIQFEFDETGGHEIAVVLHPDLAPKMMDVLKQIESDPILRKRYEEIITRKRMEWRDREAARKLVG